jgi:urease accessory protein UreE
MMPVYDEITYSDHARQRMRKRRIGRDDVELVLRIGDGRAEEDGTWIYELDTLRVIVVERGTAAHVVTVIHLRSHA